MTTPGRQTSTLRRPFVLACIAFVLVTLSCSSTGRSTSTRAASSAAASPSSTPSPESLEVTRRLDFEDPLRRGELLARVDYGTSRREVGFLPVCGRDCPPPCPCSTPIQPAAYDIDDQGRLWIADNAKSRLAVFSSSGAFAAEARGGELLLRATDVQWAEDSVAVLSQNDAGRARLLMFAESREVDRSAISFRGGEAEAYHLWTSGSRLFTTVFWADGLSDEEVPVEIAHDADGRATATEVPGRPILDGWSLFQDYAGSQVVPIEVSSSAQQWRLRIDLELSQSVEGREGHVSWESEISPDGTTHLLLFAGTEGRHATDGYWYLEVGPDGEVGAPVRLRGPRIRDDQQTRRLTLDDEGEPVVMWAGRQGVRIERLPAEAS